jgi:hypothetical protein
MLVMELMNIQHKRYLDSYSIREKLGEVGWKKSGDCR